MYCCHSVTHSCPNLCADKAEIAQQAAEDVDVPVQDVQVNGVSVVSGGVANVPMGSASDYGVFKLNSYGGLQVGSDGTLKTNGASTSNVKAGTDAAKPLTPLRTGDTAFFGLAKAAGADMASSSNPVGTYTDAAKSAIQIMLGIAGIIGTVEEGTASKPYAVGDIFLHGGALYKASSAIGTGDAIVPGTNCTQTTIIEILKGV